MSAYLLLDEKPRECSEECPLFFENLCIMQESDYGSLDIQYENCPIKYFPEERKHLYKKGYKTGYNDGWNDCIDVIKNGNEVEEND
ncbi:hypothetical protein [Frisingicoccus sp.]|uniref:hypothetical protein n=1 Tax=Frisingicoccus sp. TaxID=1918627 RepID=UPI0038706CAB